MRLKITARAEAQLESIFAYGVGQWGFEQALRYGDAILSTFDRIVARRIVWRPVPAEIGAEGFFCRCEHHFIYWRSARTPSRSWQCCTNA